MNPRRLTDADITAGLRAHLPRGASAALRERIAAEAVATRQVRRLPWLLGLADMDPAIRRRSLLSVVLLGLLATASLGLTVGALLRSPEPTEDLDGSNRADAFVLASYARIAALPAFHMVVRESGEGDLDYVYHYDGAGTLREDHGPSHTSLIARESTAHRDLAWDLPVWIVSEPQDDRHALARLLDKVWLGSVDCATGWASVERVDLIGRQTDHVRCITEEASGIEFANHLWIDIDTGLPLRASTGTVDQGTVDLGTVDQPSFRSVDVVELEFGAQPADLFVVNGAHMSVDAYLCATEDRCASPRPSASARPVASIVSPPPAPGSWDAPTDLDAFVADVHAAYEAREPVDIVFAMPPRQSSRLQWQRDGRGNYRSVRDNDPSDEQVIWLTTGGRTFETDPRSDGRVWRDWGTSRRGGTAAPDLGLPTACGVGWTYLGHELVLDRPATHLACGFQEFWIDREWMLVTRAHDRDPLMADIPSAGLAQALSITFAPLPETLFAPPPPGSVWESM